MVASRQRKHHGARSRPNSRRRRRSTTTAEPGAAVTYTVVIGSSGPARRPTTREPSSPIRCRPSSISSAPPRARSGRGRHDQRHRDVERSIPASGSVTITIDALLPDGIAPGTTIANQGSIAYDADGNGTNESSGSDRRPRGGRADDPTTFVVIAIALDRRDPVPRRGRTGDACAVACGARGASPLAAGPAPARADLRSGGPISARPQLGKRCDGRLARRKRSSSTPAAPLGALGRRVYAHPEGEVLMIPLDHRSISPGLALVLVLTGATALPAAEFSGRLRTRLQPFALRRGEPRRRRPGERASSGPARGTTPSGVLVFDDEVRWLARPGAPRADAALDAMSPAGRYTVLNDGLIEGVRALGEGGVLVLLSDGRRRELGHDSRGRRAAGERSRRPAGDGRRRPGRREDTSPVGAAHRRSLRRPDRNAGRRDPGAGDRGPAPRGRGRPGRRTPAAPAQPSGASSPCRRRKLPLRRPHRARRSHPRRPPQAGCCRSARPWRRCGIVVGFLLARRRTGSPAHNSQEPERGTEPGVQWPPPTPAPSMRGVDQVCGRRRPRPSFPPRGRSTRSRSRASACVQPFGRRG